MAMELPDGRKVPGRHGHTRIDVPDDTPIPFSRTELGSILAEETSETPKAR